METTNSPTSPGADDQPGHGTVPTSGFLPSMLDALRARRAERAERKQLERELASYRTRAERDDLTAMLDRHPDAETAYVRAILDRIHAA